MEFVRGTRKYRRNTWGRQMNTAIVGVINRQYFVFESWVAENPDERRNQWILNKHIERLSLNRPDVSLWHYIVTKKKLSKGEAFSILDYDKIVQKCQHCVSQRPQDWSVVSDYDLRLSAKLAKEDLGI